MTTVDAVFAAQADDSCGVVLALDDRALARALTERLPGLALVECDPPERAIDTVLERSTDLLVLRLRGYAALEPLRRLRSESKVPVLALVDETVDGVDALEAGSDDYVRVPCPPREIAARIASAVRRARWVTNRHRMTFGALTIDPVAREVIVNGQRVALPVLQFELLAYLAASPGRVFSREELLDAVWHASPEWLGPATVTEHVRRVRARIAEAGGRPECITTVRGYGYRFDAERA